MILQQTPELKSLLSIEIFADPKHSDRGLGAASESVFAADEGRASGRLLIFTDGATGIRGAVGLCGWGLGWMVG